MKNTQQQMKEEERLRQLATEVRAQNDAGLIQVAVQELEKLQQQAIVTIQAVQALKPMLQETQRLPAVVLAKLSFPPKIRSQFLAMMNLDPKSSSIPSENC